jgi:hypothetical protein
LTTSVYKGDSREARIYRRNTECKTGSGRAVLTSRLLPEALFAIRYTIRYERLPPVYLLYPPLVPPAIERCVQPFLQDLDREIFRDHSLAHGENVRVVVSPAQLG